MDRVRGKVAPRRHTKQSSNAFSTSWNGLPFELAQVMFGNNLCNGQYIFAIAIYAEICDA